MNQEILSYTIRVSKRDSSMLYFILESNENIAFYSTLPGDKSEAYRDIQINCHISMKPHLDSVLEHFSKKYPLEYLS